MADDVRDGLPAGPHPSAWSRADTRKADAPEGYEWYVPRLARPAKMAVWIIAVLAVAAVLWFWVFPVLQNVLPENF